MDLLNPIKTTSFPIPPGDDCFNAIHINPFDLDEYIYGDTTYSFTDDISPRCGTIFGESRGVWYTITNIYSIPYILIATTCYDTTNYDTQISIFKGNTWSNLECIGTNDDYCGSSSRVKFVATSYSTYYVYVYGYYTFGGPFTFTIGNTTKALVATIRAPVNVPLQLPAPSPMVSIPTGIAPVPVTIQVPVPTQVMISTGVAPIKTISNAPIHVPVSTPLTFPVQTIPLPTPITIPTGIAPIPQTTPISVPTPTVIGNIPNVIPTPINSPTTLNQVPTKVPTKSPTITPISYNTDCGLFGFNIFCIRRNQCGFWRRLLNLRGC